LHGLQRRVVPQRQRNLHVQVVHPRSLDQGAGDKDRREHDGGASLPRCPAHEACLVKLLIDSSVVQASIVGKRSNVRPGAHVSFTAFHSSVHAA
jgi:hypothetical protein